MSGNCLTKNATGLISGAMTDSNFKCDTASLGVMVENFAGCAVAESFPRTIIQGRRNGDGSSY